MECPKCGFHQPEEVYCARCGIHIPTALGSRRKRAFLALGATALAVILMGGAASLWWKKARQGQDPDPWSDTEERQSIPRPEPPPPIPTPTGTKPKVSAPSRKATPSQRKSHHPDFAPQASESEDVAKAPAPPTTPDQGPEPDLERQLRRWAAQEWLDKALEIRDNPELEIQMYHKALEVDPEFPQAHYHLGMAYWTTGQREAALGKFRAFWRTATPEERQTLILPQEISPEELGPPEGPGEKR